MSSLGASGADAFVERASLLHAPGLSVKGLSKSFERRQVLSDVSLDVRPGEIVGLLGPNGAGKTLCFYSVIGLLRPDAGQVFVNGSDVSRLPMDRRGALGLSYLPQEPSVFRGLTVAENISAVIELREPKRLRQNRLDALIREFGSKRFVTWPAPPCPEASGGAAKSRGRWRPAPASFFSMSHSRM